MSASARVPSHFNIPLAERHYNRSNTTRPATSSRLVNNAPTTGEDDLAPSIANLKPKFLNAGYGMPPTHTAWALALAVRALKERAATIHLNEASAVNRANNTMDSGEAAQARARRNGKNKLKAHSSTSSVINHMMRHYGEFVTHL